MSSYSRNRRTQSRAKSLVAAAALLTGSAVHADDQSHNLVFTAYVNSAGGESIMSGDYDSAVRQIKWNEHSLLMDSVSSSTNQCVAFSMAKQYSAARVACDKAILDARDERASLPMWASWVRMERNNALALAYSNRAVLNYLSHDTSAARADLDRARTLAPGAEYVARNLQAVQTRSAVAQTFGVHKG